MIIEGQTSHFSLSTFSGVVWSHRCCLLFLTYRSANLRASLQVESPVNIPRSFVDDKCPVLCRWGSFAQMTQDNVRHLISSSSIKSPMLDPIPTWMFKETAYVLLPVITAIVNELTEAFQTASRQLLFRQS